MKINWITNEKHLKGKKILLRLDLNAPQENGKVTDPFRIEKSIPTINFLVKEGAEVIIISHLSDKKESLEPVAKYLVKTFPKLRFVKDVFSLILKKEIEGMKNGDVLLLENLRTVKGEEDGSVDFSKYLGTLADIYVNDAFSVSHRNHSSVVGVTAFLPSYGGPLLQEEITELSKAFAPDHPFLLILGGAKFETKIPMIDRFFNEADNIFVCGAIANDFFKAQGYFVGDSRVSDTEIPKVFLEGKAKEKILLPIDVRTQHKGFRYIKNITDISVGEKIWDVGPKTEKMLERLVKNVSFVVWNGPLGYFEGGERQGTEAVAKILAESNATTIVGGGDTLSAIKELGLLDKFSFVSTGGGAMLDFLSAGTLPGIEALKQKSDSVIIKSSWFSKLFKN